MVATLSPPGTPVLSAAPLCPAPGSAPHSAHPGWGVTQAVFSFQLRKSTREGELSSPKRVSPLGKGGEGGKREGAMWTPVLGSLGEGYMKAPGHDKPNGMGCQELGMPDSPFWKNQSARCEALELSLQGACELPGRAAGEPGMDPIHERCPPGSFAPSHAG